MEENNQPKQHTNNYSSAQSVENEENVITLTELFRHMRARWAWYVVSIVVCLVVGVLYLLRATPMYTRSTEILLKDDSSQSIVGDLSLLGVNPVPSDILNEMFIMSSPEIMEQVVTKLGLNEVYATPAGLRKRELYHTAPIEVQAVDSLTNKALPYSFRIDVSEDRQSLTLSHFMLNGKKVSGEVSTPFEKNVKTPVGTFAFYPTKFFSEPANSGRDEEIEIPHRIYFSYVPTAACARSYSRQLGAQYDEERGNVITLTIACTSIQKADDILNSVVEAYNRRWVADKNKIAQATSMFIDERLESIERELGDVETNITDYKSSHRMLDMDAMAQLYLSQSSENQHALNALAQDIAIGKYIKNELTRHDISRLLPATAEIGGTNVQQMVTEYNRMVAERNLKLETMPASSPLMIQKTEAIERAREAILASVDAALESLNSRYKAIRLIDNQTQSQLATAPGQAKYLMSEERKQKVKESLYVFLLQKREENELNQAFTVYNTRLVTAPSGNITPTSPNTKLVLLLCLVLGVIIPTLIIYISEVMDTKVRSRRDIEDLPIPFLGEVPVVEDAQHMRLSVGRRKKQPRPKREILVKPRTGDVINEAFRMIRTNIDFMSAMDHTDTDRPGGKVISVISLNASSGKTFVSLNVAAIFALKGKKTCLVDFDFRKGTVSRNAGSPRCGITDFLIGKEMNIDRLIVRNIDGIEGFDILPEGIRPPNPTELLYSQNLVKLIDELRQHYDYIFFDCPPVAIVADARLLNPFVDLTIFVMRSGLFDKRDISTLRNLYETHRYNNLALVLNATDTIHGVYGAYGYGYRSRQKRSDR